jgi:hypothetical protein
MKTHAEMIEGPEAFERFREAAKKMVAAKKVTSPFGKRKKRKVKTKEG